MQSFGIGWNSKCIFRLRKDWINYIFDTSTPIIYNCQIEELEYDGESNYYAIIVIEEKEINLSLSTEEYYSYEIGDYIEVSCYQGALGFKYYIGE